LPRIYVIRDMSPSSGGRRRYGYHANHQRRPADRQPKSEAPALSAIPPANEDRLEAAAAEMSDILGQEIPRRALEIAAARQLGSHKTLFVGPPRPMITGTEISPPPGTPTWIANLSDRGWSPGRGPVVDLSDARGWEWRGDWSAMRNHHHFAEPSR
jgi:hypothetical protein